MNNQEFYGIRINKKIPRLKDNKNINKISKNKKSHNIFRLFISISIK